MGWHYAQLPRLAKSPFEWMNHSLEMKSDAGNVVAWSYIYIADRRKQERSQAP
jgi:hypothetical protein